MAKINLRAQAAFGRRISRRIKKSTELNKLYRARLLEEQLAQHSATPSDTARPILSLPSKSEYSTEDTPDGLSMIKGWIASNSLPSVDKDGLMLDWEKTSVSTHDRILKRILASLSVTEGLMLANESLSSTLNMKDAGLELKAIEPILEVILDLEVTNIALEHSSLKEEQKKRVFDMVLGASTSSINKEAALESLRGILVASGTLNSKKK